MRTLTVPAWLGSFFLFFLLLSTGWAVAQPGAATASNTPFELKDGDRVVFLGNSLFENDFQYGYLELALTTRWPDRNLTFRNLGWVGDNVFGEARSTFTNPPTPYEHLMNQLTKAQPTVVFLAYGGVEAEWGEDGLPRFKDGLTKLLDKFEQLGARTVLLSPIPVISGDSSQAIARRNALLEVYGTALAQTAKERGKLYIDLFKPIQEVSKNRMITDDGVHLNETGYYYLTTALEKGLGLAPQASVITVNVSKTGPEALAPAKLLGTNANDSPLTFTMDESFLPLPLPTADRETIANVRTLKITGLKKGFYALTADGSEVISASAKQWAEGVPLRQGASYDQARDLRHLIVKKNELFFYQYRPLNETYITGFRNYEQGRHVKGLEEQNILIKWLEGQIALNRMPKSKVYQLTLLK